MKRIFIFCFFAFLLKSLSAQKDVNYMHTKYLNSFNFIVFNTQTYCERWVRNEVDIVYFSNNQCYCKSFVRGSGLSMDISIDTILVLDFEKMNFISKIINKVRNKQSLRELEPKNVHEARTDYSILITNYKGILILDNVEQKLSNCLKFEYKDKLDFSLYNRLINK
jgi:protein associated with RNAse G/E